MYEVEVYKRKLDKMSGLLCEVLPDNFCERTLQFACLGTNSEKYQCRPIEIVCPNSLREPFVSNSYI